MNRFSVIGILLLACSCSFFKPKAKPHAIARVNEEYLYTEDIKDLVPAGTSKEDSIAIIRNYIDRWASQKLLINAAEVNLKHCEKNEFDALISQYKIDLYTKAYLEEIVKRSVDTVITDDELKAYYDRE